MTWEPKNKTEDDDDALVSDSDDKDKDDDDKRDELGEFFHYKANLFTILYHYRFIIELIRGKCVGVFRSDRNVKKTNFIASLAERN